MKTFLKFLLIAVIMHGAVSCAINPVTGKKQLILMSEDQEKALGVQSDPEIIAGMGLYEDAALQQFINEKGKQMAAVSHRPNLGYEFKIVDSPVVNAFAVPGGFVYFTRGIMAHFNNEAEFAGVLGHEIGHITARHSAQQYSNQMLGQVGLMAGVIISEDFRKIADVAQTGMGLLFLKFGRDHETQSDELGVEYSSKIGYDANEMAGFFKTLQRLSDQGGGRVPTFLSTHPDPGGRNQKVAAEATKWQQGRPGDYKVGRDSYLRMIDNMVYGEDPRQGYVESGCFLPPGAQIPVSGACRLAIRKHAAAVPDGAQRRQSLDDIEFVAGQDLAGSSAGPRRTGPTHRRHHKSYDGQRAAGLCTLAGEQVNPETKAVIRILGYFIQHNNLIYQILGLSTPQDMAAYMPYFEHTMRNFRNLSDPSKINVTPERIKIKSVLVGGTLEQSLRAYHMPEARLPELSILNGMELKDRVTAGMLIKTVGK
jgi:predicted Zn-dependent protease